MMRLRWAVLVVILALVGPGFARPALGAEASPAPRALSPEERSRMRENLERWRQLSPEEQQRIRENYERWRQLSPDEREAIRRRFEAYRKLPPQERQQLREEFRHPSYQAPREPVRPQPGMPSRPRGRGGR